MPEPQKKIFTPECAQRLLGEQRFFQEDSPGNYIIGDKWAVLILAALNEGPRRFNAIKRLLSGITQKSLTQSLRRLERNGFVERRVIPVSPVGVEYEITALGRTLEQFFLALYQWSMEHQEEVEKARREFDARGRGELE
jgi:DNA-binding HxlR family transcriptional regulator